MPFKSDRQRKYMFANHPEIAKRWLNEEKPSPQEKPKKKRKKQ